MKEPVMLRASWNSLRSQRNSGAAAEDGEEWKSALQPAAGASTRKMLLISVATSRGEVTERKRVCVGTPSTCSVWLKTHFATKKIILFHNEGFFSGSRFTFVH